MKSIWEGFRSAAGESIESYLTHKRALGRRFRSEEMALRMLDRFLVDRGVTSLEAITTEQLETFVSSRRRLRPRSYNHLLGVVRRLFDWLVGQGRLGRSPVAIRPRRDTAVRIPFLVDVAQARRPLGVASRLPDRSGAPLRGATYRTIFALLYGLGLRVGEVSRLCVRDVDLGRQLLVIRASKFSKSRLVPFGPRMRDELVHQLRLQTLRRGALPPGSPVFTFRGGHPVRPGTISPTSHHRWPRSRLSLPPCVAPRPPGLRPPRPPGIRRSGQILPPVATKTRGLPGPTLSCKSVVLPPGRGQWYGGKTPLEAGTTSRGGRATSRVARKCGGWRRRTLAPGHSAGSSPTGRMARCWGPVSRSPCQMSRTRFCGSS